MLDLSWKVFSMTGDVNTYLLVKELERDLKEHTSDDENEENPLDAPLQ